MNKPVSRRAAPPTGFAGLTATNALLAALLVVAAVNLAFNIVTAVKMHGPMTRMMHSMDVFDAGAGMLGGAFHNGTAAAAAARRRADGPSPEAAAVAALVLAVENFNALAASSRAADSVRVLTGAARALAERAGSPQVAALLDAGAAAAAAFRDWDAADHADHAPTSLPDALLHIVLGAERAVATLGAADAPAAVASAARSAADLLARASDDELAALAGRVLRDADALLGGAQRAGLVEQARSLAVAARTALGDARGALDEARRNGVSIKI